MKPVDFGAVTSPIPRTRIRVGFALVLVSALVVAFLTSGCATPRGGWDLERLRGEEPQLAEFPGHRLGDLVPYPAPLGAGLELVACRRQSIDPIVVRLRLTGERVAWAQRAIASLSNGTPGFELSVEPAASTPHTTSVERAASTLHTTFVESAASTPHAMSRMIEVIEIVEFESSNQNEGPRGVGDTLVACNVSNRADVAFGTLTSAVIRMRSTVLDQIDEAVAVAAEDWTGALMHELGHALGFQGHLGGGRSVLLLDQSELRRAGRSALAGKDWRDETLAALYEIVPGRRLGRRPLSARSQRWRAGLEVASGEQGDGPFARVGDRHAELEWQSASGEALRLHLPFWPRQLREAAEIVGFARTPTVSTSTPAVDEQ